MQEQIEIVKGAMGLPTVTLHDTMRIIVHALKAKAVPMIWGPPGLGKTQVSNQSWDIFKYLKGFPADSPFYSLRLAQLEPPDLRGIPFPNWKQRRTVWLPPEWFPSEGCGCFMLDEIPACLPSMQVPAMQLVEERRIGDMVLPDNYYMIAAGNRLGDRSHVQAFSKALGNRFGVHIEVHPDLDVFRSWAVRGDSRWALPKSDVDLVPGQGGKIHPDVFSFLSYRPKCLYLFDPADPSPAFASPRSYELLSRQYPFPPGLELVYASGIIGMGAAQELVGFLKVKDSLPDLDACLSDPEHTRVPTASDARYAITAALSMRVTKKNLNNYFKYLSRMDVEYDILGGKLVWERDKSFMHVDGAYSSWARRYPEVFISAWCPIDSKN